MEHGLTFEKVWAMFQETDKKFQETDRKFQEDREQDREQTRELKAALLETDRIVKSVSQQLDGHTREIKAALLETDRIVKSVSQQLGGIGNSNGAAAENYFYNSFSKTKMFGNEKFDYADRNLKWRTRDLQDEYDIVLFNGQSIGIIEVKYDAEKKHIAQTINKATTFRQLFPTYKDFTFYLGLASFVFEKDVEQAALDAGIAVIKQVGDNMVVQDERIRKF